jgi:hypothetical protein
MAEAIPEIIMIAFNPVLKRWNSRSKPIFLEIIPIGSRSKSVTPSQILPLSSDPNYFLEIDQ